MDAPAYLLLRPGFYKTPEMMAAFDALFQASEKGGFIEYTLPYPKWQFLSYLCETHELVLHGSQDLEIQQVEPRQANDKRAFSSQHAIYATTDGIWVIYFAILDRIKYPAMGLFNSCLQACISLGQLSEPMYFFSISQSVRLKNPWCTGAVYILARQPFIQELAQNMGGNEIIFPHWISTTPVQPVRKLLVGPEDFPFLDQIHGHIDEKLVQLAAADPLGFPWPEALES